ncbi:hypothetical protein LXL04_028939 [Taraxacum kok-saghyz]
MRESDWREVKKKKRPERNTTANTNETTYFVSNVPKDAKKAEIRSVFTKFGRLTDVFMGTNRGKNGKYYVFIRFTEVEDTQELDNRLHGIIFRGRTLEVNLAKHRRKDLPRTHTQQHTLQTNHKRYEPQPRTNFDKKFRDQRSYAQVMNNEAKNQPMNPPPPPPPIPSAQPLGPWRKPITIWQEAQTHEWLRKTSLIGEASSLTHLGHLPKLLRTWNGARIGVSYLGEMRVLLEFDNSVAAREFQDNKDRWKEYMNWIDEGEKVDIGSDRVAWIRIVGLPLHLWGKRNFAAITKEFGKTIAPFEAFTERVDLSCVKIGILTEKRLRINEEMFLNIVGQLLKIDEFGNDVNVDDVINPILGNKKKTVEDLSKEEPEEGEIREEEAQQPLPKTVEIEEIEVDEESGGIPETPMDDVQPLIEEIEDDKEPGDIPEFPLNDGHDGENMVDMSEIGATASTSMPVGESVIGTDTRDDTLAVGSTHGNYNYSGISIPTEMQSPPQKMAALMTDENLCTPVKARGGGTQKLTFVSNNKNCNQAGLLDGLPLGGFGPFPLTFHPGLSNTPSLPPELNVALGKRKRNLTGGINGARLNIPSMPPLTEKNNHTPDHLPLTMPVEEINHEATINTKPINSTEVESNPETEQPSIWGSENTPHLDERNNAINSMTEEEITV